MPRAAARPACREGARRARRRDLRAESLQHRDPAIAIAAENHVAHCVLAVCFLDVDDAALSILDQHRADRDDDRRVAARAERDLREHPGLQAVDPLRRRQVNLHAARFRIDARADRLDARREARRKRRQLDFGILARRDAARFAFGDLRDDLQQRRIAELEQRFAACADRRADRDLDLRDDAVRRRAHDHLAPASRTQQPYSLLRTPVLGVRFLQPHFGFLPLGLQADAFFKHRDVALVHGLCASEAGVRELERGARGGSVGALDPQQRITRFSRARRCGPEPRFAPCDRRADGRLEPSARTSLARQRKHIACGGRANRLDGQKLLLRCAQLDLPRARVEFGFCF
jgi:hypothetical protein